MKMEVPMSTLNKALELAARAHEGQKDKAGAPYILHPLRVMMKGDTEAEMIAGILHDVVEDTDTTMSDLESMGFDRKILAAVDALTKRKEEDYETFVRRAAFDPIAREVKLRDIKDNLDLLRLTALTEKDCKRLEQYMKAHAYLLHIREITKGVTAGEFYEGSRLERLCARLYLIPDGVNFVPHILRNGPAVIHFIVWSSYSEVVPAERFEDVRNALIAGDAKALYEMNPDWAPVYCPICNKNYHMSEWRVLPGDEDYRTVHGACPKGHERLLES